VSWTRVGLLLMCVIGAQMAWHRYTRWRRPARGGYRLGGGAVGNTAFERWRATRRQQLAQQNKLD
jgi:hypothetical protein